MSASSHTGRGAPGAFARTVKVVVKVMGPRGSSVDLHVSVCAWMSLGRWLVGLCSRKALGRLSDPCWCGGLLHLGCLGKHCWRQDRSIRRV